MHLFVIVLAAAFSMITSILLSRLVFLISRDLFCSLPAPKGSILANRPKDSSEYRWKMERRAEPNASLQEKFLVTIACFLTSAVYFTAYLVQQLSSLYLFAVGLFGALTILCAAVIFALLIFGLVWMIYGSKKVYHCKLRDLRFIDHAYDRSKAACRAACTELTTRLFKLG